MGDATNPYVPFQITYIQHEPKSNSNNFTPLNVTTVPCNQAVSVCTYYPYWKFISFCAKYINCL